MDDLIEFDGGKNFVERGAVGDVAVDEFKRFGERLDFAEVAALELRVVKIVEVVERPDGMAVAQEPFANVRADETRAAGDQKIHGRTLTIRARAVECEDAHHEDVNQVTKKPKRRFPLSARSAGRGPGWARGKDMGNT